MNTLNIIRNINGNLPAPCGDPFILLQETVIALSPPFDEREAGWGWGGYRQLNKTHSSKYRKGETPSVITLLINGRATSVNIKEMSIKMTYNYPQFLPKLAEWHVYGNEQQGRFLTKYPEQEPTYYGVDINEDIRNNIFSRQLGKKAYELKDHLGNVRVTFSDVKMPTANDTFTVDLLIKNEYYPYGSALFSVGGQLSQKGFGFLGGVGIGLKASSIDSKLDYFISMTNKQFDNLKQTGLAITNVIIEQREKILNKDKDIIGYKGQLYNYDKSGKNIIQVLMFILVQSKMIKIV